MTIIATFVHSMVIGAFFLPADTALNQTMGCNASLGTNATALPQIDAQMGYMVSAFVFAAVAVAPLVLLLLCVPEREVGKKKRPVRRDGSVRTKQFTVWESFVTIITNRAFVCVTIIYLFSQLAIQFVQNNLILYIKVRKDRFFFGVFFFFTFLFAVCFGS